MEPSIPIFNLVCALVLLVWYYWHIKVQLLTLTAWYEILKVIKKLISKLTI